MIAALTIAAVLAAPQDFEVRPANVAWKALSDKGFDRRWTLPEERREGRDLLAEMRRLAVLRVDVDLGEGRKATCFGDLVAAARELDGSARMAWLASLEQRAPKLHADWGAGLAELLLDDHLHSDDWKPSRDHARDGFIFAEDWELGEEYGQPWTDLKVDTSFVQSGVLIHADLATIKEIENDYRLYPQNVGADYEEIFPLQDRYFCGQDPDGVPFSTMAIRFKCDLPFPFSGYSCKLHILNRVDEDGIARCDIYSTSSDFHYLAGRDVFLPVMDSQDRQVAFLVVRHFGFDLDGVPDKRKHRVEALRTSLGNLKRNSEARFSAEERSFGELSEAIAGFPVFGRK